MARLIVPITDFRKKSFPFVKNPAIKSGLVRLTIPDKPTSKNQMYYKI